MELEKAKKGTGVFTMNLTAGGSKESFEGSQNTLETELVSQGSR